MSLIQHCLVSNRCELRVSANALLMSTAAAGKKEQMTLGSPLSNDQYTGFFAARVVVYSRALTNMHFFVARVVATAHAVDHCVCFRSLCIVATATNHEPSCGNDGRHPSYAERCPTLPFSLQ